MLTEGPTEEEAQRVSEHFQHLQKLMGKGMLILAGRTQNSDYSSFGIALFEAESDEAMREIVANDPAVKHRVMRAEWYPYRLACSRRRMWAANQLATMNPENLMLDEAPQTPLIAIGTQVVTRIVTLNKSGKIAHPAGAVGVIVSWLDDRRYRVRFLDGYEENFAEVDLAVRAIRN